MDNRQRRAILGASALILLVYLASQFFGASKKPSGPTPGAADGSPTAGKPMPTPVEAPTSADIERLEALGYVDYVTPTTDASGVTQHDLGSTFAGLNLMTRNSRAEAVLLDMWGKPVHTWQGTAKGGGKWHHAEVLPDGSLLVAVKYRRLEKRAWDSTLVWATPIRAHHDFDVTADGRIHALVRHRVAVNNGPHAAVLQLDGIAMLTPAGEVERIHWLVEPLRGHVPDAVIEQVERIVAVLAPAENGKRMKQSPPLRAPDEPARPGEFPHRGDILHTNSIEVLEQDVSGLGTKGQVLLSFRNTNEVVVYDRTEGRTVWKYADGLDGQHHATVVAGGHVQLFDNGMHRGYSRVVELDPVSRTLVWQYPADATGPGGLLTKTRGSAQRLPNGNVLITVSNEAMALEVTRTGDIVWQWHNPDAWNGQRAAVYRLERVTRASIGPLSRVTGSETPSPL